MRRLAEAIVLLLLLSVPVGLLSPSPGAAQGTSGFAPVTWTITGSETVTDVREVNGSVRIASGGSLQLTGGSLHFKSSSGKVPELRVESGGRLTADGCTFRNVLPTARARITIDGQASIRDCTFDGLGGVAPSIAGVLVRNDHVEITNSRFTHAAWAGLSVSGASARIRGCTFEDSHVGLIITGNASVRVDDTIIRRADRIGIRIDGSSPLIRNTTISGGGTGITGLAMGGRIEQVSIDGGDVGIDITNSSGLRISEGIISGTTRAGVHTWGAVAEIDGLRIDSQGEGLNATGGAVTVRTSRIRSVGPGLVSFGGDLRVSGTNVTADADYGVLAYKSTPVIGGGSVGGALGRWRQIWFLTVRVVNATDQPVAGAQVTVQDARGMTVEEATTGPDGRSPEFIVDEYTLTSTGTRVNSTPHRVRVTAANHSREYPVNAVRDIEVEAKLGTVAPPTFRLPDQAVMVGILILLLVGVIGSLALFRRRLVREDRRRRAERRIVERGGRRGRERRRGRGHRRGGPKG